MTRFEELPVSHPDQALEVLAALSLNKRQLAEVLGVSGPTLHDWLEGREPNATNAQRLTSLARILAEAGVTSAHAISPRFVRQSLLEGEPSLLEALKADTLDEQRIAGLVEAATELEDHARSRRIARERRLTALGLRIPRKSGAEPTSP